MTQPEATKPLVISLSVVTDDHNHALRAYEVLGRAAVGLALEGIQVGTNITTIDILDEEDGESP